MLALKDSYYKPIEKDLILFFWEQFYAPLLEIVNIPNIKLNATDTAILAAIKSGKVQYIDGVFTGRFDARLSRELSTFAKFDRRSGTWKGNAPPSIKAASIFAESKRKELSGRLERAISESESTVKQTIETLSFGQDLPLFAMGEDIGKDLYKIGVMPKIDERTERTLRKDYTENMKLNIVDENNPGECWSSKQVERLREMVRRIQTSGDQVSIKAMIESEWNTTAAKAKFLASQETRLFFDTLSRDRAKRTGVRKYKWSSSHDARTREDHRLLQGTIVDLASEGPIVDRKTGRRAHAGADFGCRCQKIWVLE